MAFLIPGVASAPTAAKKTTSKTVTDTSIAPITGTFSDVPNPNIYNLLREPQFRLQALGIPSLLTGDRSISVSNGGIGNGGPTSYFCGPWDEADSYTKFINRARIHTNNPNLSDLPYGGTYNFLQLTDQCRLIQTGVDRCGGSSGIGPHNIFSVIGIPTHATNCYHSGRRYVFDHPRYQDPFINKGDPNWTPLNIENPDWYGRNFIDAGPQVSSKDFLFSRYLVKEFGYQEPFSPGDIAAIRDGMKLQLPSTIPYVGDAYHPAAAWQPTFLDIPHSIPHLAYFTCAQVAKAGGYKANAPLQNYNFDSCEEWVMEGERRAYYVDLLKQARDYIGDQIAKGTYGDLYTQPLNTNERLMSEIVGNAWAALNQVIPKLHNGDYFGNTDLDKMALPPGGIELSCCPVPNGVLVDFQDYDLSTTPVRPRRICVRPDICDDCQSKRGQDTNAFFNVAGRDGTGNCKNSYGAWRNDPYGKSKGKGLFELFGKHGADYEAYIGWAAPPSAQWESEAESKGYTGAYYSGHIRRVYPPRDGYGAVIASMIAHQAVHATSWGFEYTVAHYKQMERWPSPESMWEEKLAVMTQALVFNALSELGHASQTFRMQKGFFNRDPEDLDFPGRAGQQSRFFYQDAPIGYKGIFLGAYYTDMYNIDRWLELQKPDMAMMLAVNYALAPLADLPKKMTINGLEMDFKMGVPEPVHLQCDIRRIQDWGGAIDPGTKTLSETTTGGSLTDGTISPLLDGTITGTGTTELSIDTQFSTTDTILPTTDGSLLTITPTTETTLTDTTRTEPSTTTTTVSPTTLTETTISPTTTTTTSPTTSTTIQTAPTTTTTTTDSTSTWDSILNFFGGGK